MYVAIGGKENLEVFRQQAMGQQGEETSVISEDAQHESGFAIYLRTSEFSLFTGTVNVEWAFDATGSVAGFSITPASPAGPAPSEYLEYETQARLRLPFAGEWLVVWGGRTVEENYHAAHADQRFAYDLLVIEDGSSYSNDGSRNEDYYCFGSPILAPAAGTVVTATGGVADNIPGKLNETATLGNHVVLDHGQGEYSFLAHLQLGSVQVAAGDRVEVGTVLGACGNSGRSSEPHLHYHLQNGPGFGQGQGLPAQFRNYLSGGEHVAIGEPVQGQLIQPME